VRTHKTVAVYFPQQASCIHSNQDNQPEEWDRSGNSDPFSNRQIAVAMFTSRFTEGLETFRPLDDLTARWTSSEAAAQPGMLLNGRDTLIPNGPTGPKNPILSMSFVHECGA